MEQAGIKFDKDKPRFDLIDPLAMEGLALVLTAGAAKYDANNWRKGLAYTRLISSLERHLNAFKRGEDIDPETGLPHIDHLGCNWHFLSYFTKQRPDLDDRWYTNKENKIPYITKEARENLYKNPDNYPTSAGELNFFISKLVWEYLPDKPSYSDFNEVIGVLECAKLELYRRLVVPYEEQKLHDNGDVYLDEEF